MSKKDLTLVLVVIVMYMALMTHLTVLKQIDIEADTINLEKEIASQNEDVERKTIELDMLNEQIEINNQFMDSKFWFVIENKELFKGE